MKILTEKRAEDFLKKQGFSAAKTFFIKKETELKKSLNKLRFPVVMKISSKKIVHKTEINGVRLGINSYEKALKAFRELKRIRGIEGILIQKQINGKEFLIGLKKTHDFGFVIGFGRGKNNEKRLKNIEFRVCGAKGVEELSKNKKIRKFFNKLCSLTKKHPDINFLDINPLIVNKKQAVIADSQIFFE